MTARPEDARGVVGAEATGVAGAAGPAGAAGAADAGDADAAVQDGAELEAAVRAVAERDRNLEGVPMFLVLEDLTGTAPPPAPVTEEGRELGRLAEAYLGRISADPETAHPGVVATALEVLAAHHFEPKDPA